MLKQRSGSLFTYWHLFGTFEPSDTLRMIYNTLEMKATRLDVAVDHCPFSPDDLRREWVSDNVRTNCKPAKKAKPGREHIRTCKWDSSPTGDTFYMGSSGVIKSLSKALPERMLEGDTFFRDSGQ